MAAAVTLSSGDGTGALRCASGVVVVFAGRVSCSDAGVETTSGIETTASTCISASPFGFCTAPTLEGVPAAADPPLNPLFSPSHADPFADRATRVNTLEKNEFSCAAGSDRLNRTPLYDEMSGMISVCVRASGWDAVANRLDGDDGDNNADANIDAS